MKELWGSQMEARRQLDAQGIKPGTRVKVEVKNAP